MAKVKFPDSPKIEPSEDFIIAGDQVNEERVFNNLENETKNTQEDKAENVNNVENTAQVESLENDLKFARVELEDWKDKATRLSADIQNLNKQTELDLAQAKKSAKKNTATAILNFLNTLNLAFSFVPQTNDQKMIVFIETLKTSFQKVLEDFKLAGVEILVPVVGETFNPETMSLLNSPEDSDPKIKQVVTLGIKIDGVLVQPASVLA